MDHPSGHVSCNTSNKWVWRVSAENIKHIPLGSMKSQFVLEAFFETLSRVLKWLDKC
jgi:hypothetical protein